MEHNALSYSNFIIVREEYLKAFNEEWERFLDSFNVNVSEAQQLHIGNQVRPQLVLWGALLNKEDCTEVDYRAIAKVAVSIEAVHKASVLIDDIIDGDAKRRGVACVHHVYGEYPTLLFAICLLIKGIAQIDNYSHRYSGDTSLKIIKILCETIQAMCLGAIDEISASTQQQMDLKRILRIIDFETAQLIKNSLYMGFILTAEPDDNIGQILCTIGTKCGYIFQVMNDLEPFCNPKYIEDYKGKVNFDFVRSRKNIVIPYLYRSCSKSDKEIVLACLDNQGAFDEILRLFHKYKIKTQITTELEYTYKSIGTSLADIENQHKKWAIAFGAFINDLRQKYSSILYS